MKKHLLLLFLIGLISCKETNPKGVWITVKEKQMTSKNGYAHGITSLVVDFDKLECHFLSNYSESVSKFIVDSPSNSIIPVGDSAKIGYKLYRNDSLEVYIKRQNLTKVLIPLDLSHELDSSKEKIIQLLIEQQSYTVNDTIQMVFSNDYFDNNYFTKGIKDKRILRSSSPSMQHEGYWYIGQKNKNFFLIIDPDPYTTREYIFQITNVNEKKIALKDISTEGLLIRIPELKPVYNKADK